MFTPYQPQALPMLSHVPAVRENLAINVAATRNTEEIPKKASNGLVVAITLTLA